MERHHQLRRIYAAFNARDAEAVLAEMTDDVEWPRAFKGGRVVGPAEVRAYWADQWAEIEPTVEPVGFTERPDGTVAVDVDQVVRDKAGAIIGEGRVIHVYAFRGDRVARMDIEEPV